MPLSPLQAAHILNILESITSNLAELIVVALQFPQFSGHSAVAWLPINTIAMLDTLRGHQPCQNVVEEWAYGRVVHQLTKEVVELTRKSSGWHFGASTARIEELESFDLSVMVQKMQTMAPHVCDLISRLLEADEDANRGREARRRARVAKRK